MTIFKVKDVDDLELVECPAMPCKNGKVRRYRTGTVIFEDSTCPVCMGTGDVVIHRVKYFERQRLDRREKRLLVSR